VAAVTGRLGVLTRWLILAAVLVAIGAGTFWLMIGPMGVQSP
jgi:hypothetical protein